MPQLTRGFRTPALSIALLVAGLLAGLAVERTIAETETQAQGAPMQLGRFSLSLAVEDLDASREFYRALGFSPVDGNPEEGWQILRNDEVVIGLFQGMFEKNIMTFNPGWDGKGDALEQFQDVRDIQARLKDAGVELLLETDPDGEGMGHIVLQDPDGNQIMFDQHVPAPGD